MLYNLCYLLTFHSVGWIYETPVSCWESRAKQAAVLLSKGPSVALWRRGGGRMSKDINEQVTDSHIWAHPRSRIRGGT